MNKSESEIYKKRWIILLTVLSATFMATLDGSIVNVALPNMSDKLNVSMASIEWVVTSFLIVIVATILIFGRLGDIKGKTAIFQFGVVLFTIGSLLCGFTSSLEFLVIARAIQAIGASAAMATSHGIITQVFPPKERGRALGVLGSFVALGALTGPPLGGIMVSVLSWEYIFLINVPIGIIVFFFSMKVFPKPKKILNEKFDIIGAVLFTISMVLLFGALVQGQITGYNNLYIISSFITAFVTFIIFLFVESKVEFPLLYLEIFSNSLYTISIICAFISFVVISVSGIIMPFYLQDSLKLSPASTGFFLMVSPIVLALISPLSGYLSDKIGSEILTLIGLGFTTLGLLFMGTLNESSSIIIMMVYISIMTIGNGMFQSPNNSLVMSLVPKDKLGIAGSVNALIRNLGFVFGTALSTLLLYNRMSYKVGYRVVDYIRGRDDVFIYGMRYVYISSAALCAVGVVITALRLYYRRESKKDENKVSEVESKAI